MSTPHLTPSRPSRDVRANKPLPTAERVREILNYDPLTGVFTRRVTVRGARSGDIAGYRRPDGYFVISIDGAQYRAHRIAWLYVNGAWPTNLIDHINGVSDDNRIANLREATDAENNQNRRRAKARGASGYIGVSWHNRGRRWVANIAINGEQIYLGLFDTEEAASEAYLKAKRKHHPFCTI
jgi:hypothetical protein